MELNREEHPVGTEFLGFRARYTRGSTRSGDDGPIPEAYGEGGESGPPVGRRSESGNLNSYRVMEYSASGTFARLAELQDTERRCADDPAVYGYWIRAERLEVLERLHVTNAQ